MVGVPGQVSFLGGGASCYDSSYLGEFLCCPEVIGIATKFGFRESWVIMGNHLVYKY